MEITKYFKLLLKNKYLLVLIPLAAVVITYFLVQNLPDVYKSNAQISAGLVDRTQNIINARDELSDQAVNQQFSNMLSIMEQSSVLNMVTYRLLRHDLGNPVPFRKIPEKFDFPGKKRLELMDVIDRLYERPSDLKDIKASADYKVLTEFAEVMKYDVKSLRSKLEKFRIQNSDYINIEFTSENAQLSAFVANAVAEEFTRYYNSLLKDSQNNSADFLGDLVKQRRFELDSLTRLLRDYKIQKGILNLADQSKTLNGQIADYESLREANRKSVVSSAGAVSKIDQKFNPKTLGYYESSIYGLNQQIVNDQQQIDLLTRQYVESGFKTNIKKQIDSVKKHLEGLVTAASENYPYNPLVAKSDLIGKKLQLQVEGDKSFYSTESINEELERLNRKFTGLVPHEAVIQSYENDIMIAGQAYLDALNKYNQVNLQNKTATKVRLVEPASPNKAEPSKKVLYIVFSGVVSLFFCLLVLFIIFLLDNTIRTPLELQRATKLPVLGSFSRISDPSLDIQQVWEGNTTSSEALSFKNALRAFRFEALNAMVPPSKIMYITSMMPNEGKTLISLSVAYAYLRTGLKVLLIDGNFSHSSITKKLGLTDYIEDYLNKEKYIDYDNIKYGKPLLKILGNQGNDESLYEVAPKTSIDEVFAKFQEVFDLIIIESGPLVKKNEAKEWYHIGGTVVAVFQADQSIDSKKEQMIEYYRSLGNNFGGWIMTKVKAKS